MLTPSRPVELNAFGRLWSSIGPLAHQCLERVGESGHWILGSEVQGFEQKLARLLSAREAVGCANGMDAIEIALRSCGLLPNEPVLTTPLSAFATSLAIHRAGGIPVFCDIDEHGLLDLNEAETLLKKFRESGTPIRWMVPVHLYGRPLDLEQLERLRDRWNLNLIEDGAQSIGSCWGDAPVGSVGIAHTLSFYPTKNLGTMGDGGAVLFSNSEHAMKARLLRNYGQSAQYVHEELGLNSRLDELHAALLSTCFLPQLEQWTHRRNQIAQRYLAEIKHSQICLPRLRSQERPVWHLFPISVPSQGQHFVGHLKEKGIQSGKHYPTLIPDQHAAQIWAHKVTWPTASNASLHRARKFAQTQVSLPIHPFLREDEVSRVIDACNEWRPLRELLA